MGVPNIFGERATTAIIMEIEVALAQAQAELGIIPQSAADHIKEKAQPEFALAEDVARMREKVGHPLVALLRTWSNSLDDEAAAYLHYGATTPDIRLTTQIIQMRRTFLHFQKLMLDIEARLLSLARTHRATPMMGRTVGRHALPITFGLKATTWMLENRRNIERMQDWLQRNNTGVLGGAVGTYAALGEMGFQVEALVMSRLGFDEPEPADWKGTRDKHAQWGCTLAISAKSFARMAQEIFLLQGDDFEELDENNEEVGSSTMPHKSNPRRSTGIIALSRQIAHESGVLLDWMVSIFERDQIANDSTLESMATKMEQLLMTARDLLDRLVVYPKNMERNLGRTGGLIMAERVMFTLGQHVGKHHSHILVRDITKDALDRGISFRDALLGNPEVCRHLSEQDIDAALDHRTYVGLAPESVDRAIQRIQTLRNSAPLSQS